MATAVFALPQTTRASDPPDVNSLALSATYDVEASFGWEERRVTVTTSATVSNTARWPVKLLAFNLATLRTGNARLGAVTVDGSPVDATADDQTVVVPLGRELLPGENVAVRIEYTARLAARSELESDDWSFARIGDVLTAYRWIPWLSRTTRFDRPSVGEPFVTANSPDVRVTITTDRALTFASSGSRTAGSPAGLTQEFVATNVRDFNLAASPSYNTQSVVVTGTPITFFHRGLPADTVLDIAANAVREYSARVGGYPHDELTIAEIGPWAPYESPAHIWLPENASPRLLPWMVAHEVAHQWFYSAVGSDQAREPFADEAIADFMARDHLNTFVDSQCPRGELDQSIYELGECYPWVIYVQGVEFLRDHRDQLGSGRFWRAVAEYYEAHRNRIGGTRSLLDALDVGTGRPLAVVARFPRLLPPSLPCLAPGAL